MVKVVSRDIIGDTLRYVKYEVCCKDFAKSMESETDNESYGSLTYVSYDNKEKFHIGSVDLKNIKFCPWCGKRAIVRKDVGRKVSISKDAFKFVGSSAYL